MTCEQEASMLDNRTKPNPQPSTGELVGKTAVVTGSTSGIGLGIARSFAQAGIDVMLNGFGNANEIEATRAGLASEFGVKVIYSGADMSKPGDITKMITDAIAA